MVTAAPSSGNRRASAASSPSIMTLMSVTLLLLCLSLSVSLTSAASNCAEGTYCPPDYISPNSSVVCIPSQYCPGNETGSLCRKGFYCPTPRELIVCPEGSYCPPASIQPRPCSGLASCPEGSYRYLHWGCLVLLIILLPTIAALNRFYTHFNQKTKQKSFRQAALLPTTAVPAAASHAQAAPRKGSSLLQLDQVPRMEIKFQNLAAHIQLNGKPKAILSDVTGEFKSSRLIAVMGPSGAGKSSLIAVLTGQVPASSGVVETRIEGQLEADLKKARKLGMIGVVPQADTMLPELTPLDIITHSAQTRLPTDWSQERKAARVQETLRVLGLTHVQHSPTGNEDARGLSGGELKRTSVGIELVNSPSLLILDEPTTGLDATSANSLLSTLKSITQLQTTVVAVLHQPRMEIFNKFDDLLLLAPGGRTVFFGEAKHMLSYFTSIGFACPPNTNPSDHVIDVIAGKAGGPKLGGDQEEKQAEGKKKDEYDEVEFGSPRSQSQQQQPKAPVMSAQQIQDYLVQSWEQRRDSFASEHKAVSAANVSGSTLKAAQSFRPSVALPSWFRLVSLYLRRGLLQSLWRNLGQFQIDAFLHILAGGVIGMAFVDENWFVGPIPPEYVKYCPEPLQRSCAQDAVRNVIDLMSTYTCMALGLVAAIIGTRLYGSEIQNSARESSLGLSQSSYFLGKNASDLPSLVINAFLYCVSFYLICSPAASFGEFYAVILLFEFCMLGVGQVSSLLFAAQENALLCSAIAALLGGLATDNNELINQLCWSRWASEGLFLAEARLDLLPEPLHSSMQRYLTLTNNFDADAFPTSILALVIYGIVLRFLAFALFKRRFKQK